MAQIALSLKSDSTTLHADGDVFEAPVDDGDAPVVTDVVASYLPRRSS